jgi:hypothetical protein
VQASRGSRFGVVRIGGCPFEFKSLIGRGGRESSVETNVAATASPPVNNIDAPAPSSDALDSINLGPGSISLPCALAVGWIAPLLSSWESLRVSAVSESSCFPWLAKSFFFEFFLGEFELWISSSLDSSLLEAGRVRESLPDVNFLGEV